MLTFDQLTKAQQEKAIENRLNVLLSDIVAGVLCFDDSQNGDNLQAAIDSACAESERMHTPWFAGEYIMDATFDGGNVGKALRSLAGPMAEDAIYIEPFETAIRLSDIERGE